MKKTMIASGVALALGAPAANAALVTDVSGSFDWSTDSANFTMLNDVGATAGFTNDVNMVWDGNAYNASSDYTGPGSASNVAMSTDMQFAGRSFIMHDVQMFTPGVYSFDTTLGGGNSESGILNVTVPASQMGLHMLFDWGSNFNLDVFVVLAPSSVFGAGIGRSSQGTTYGSNLCDTGAIQNCLYDSGLFGDDGKPAGNTVWMLASVDGNGDGVMGIPMASGGPFQGFNANFNANMTPAPRPPAVPVPAAVWLFGSGLLGLVGVAHRKKNT